MSLEPVVPLTNAENEPESPYVAPGTERELRNTGSATTSPDRLLEPEYRDSRPLGEIPAPSAQRLRGTAETVGSAVGKAVNTARDLPRRLAEMKERFTVIRGRTQENATSTAAEISDNAKQKMYKTRTRVEHYAREYPVQFILGAGGACFVLGMLLRIWRSSRHA